MSCTDSAVGGAVYSMHGGPRASKRFFGDGVWHLFS